MATTESQSLARGGVFVLGGPALSRKYQIHHPVISKSRITPLHKGSKKEEEGQYYLFAKKMIAQQRDPHTSDVHNSRTSSDLRTYCCCNTLVASCPQPALISMPRRRRMVAEMPFSARRSMKVFKFEEEAPVPE